jgi:RNA polymerase sigma factor (sigma-70 family)
MSASIGLHKLPDAELAARVRAGDTNAFDSIVKRYSPMMLGFFLNELGSDQFQQAEDLTSETMTAAWTTLRNGRSALPENLKAWLFGTARHMLARHFKEKSTTGTILAFEPDTYDFEDQKALDDFREVEYEQGLPRFPKLVDSAIESMPTKYRDVIRINMRDGKTGKALAAQVGVTPAEASRLLNEARPKLADAVATLLVTRTCREACPKFDSYLQTAGWAGGPFSDGLRRRLMQHISGCPTCKSARSRNKWIVFLPGLVPVLVAPELHPRILNVAFTTRDAGSPSTSHRSNGDSSSAQASSTSSKYTHRSVGVQGPTTDIANGSSEVIYPSEGTTLANTVSDNRDTGTKGSSKLRTGIVSLVAAILLSLLGIAAYHTIEITQRIVNRPVPVQQVGALEIAKNPTPPSQNTPSTGASDQSGPIKPGASDQSGPIKPGASDQSGPIKPGASDQTRATQQGNGCPTGQTPYKVESNDPWRCWPSGVPAQQSKATPPQQSKATPPQQSKATPPQQYGRPPSHQYGSTSSPHQQGAPSHSR